MNRMDRLLGFLHIFQGKELVRAQDLAERFEVSKRTVYRDIDALCELGVPIYGVTGEGYRLMDGYYLPPIMFDEEEARALFLAVSLLSSFTPKGNTRTAAQSSIEKIRSVLPKATLAQVEALHAILGFYASGRPPLILDEPKFVQISEAIQNRQVIKLQYHAMHNNSVTERDVEPLHLSFIANFWGLSGWCRLRKGMRHFRLDRVDSVQVLSERFDPMEFDQGPQKEIDKKDALEVVVRFQPHIVRWVHETQHFTFVREEPDKNGSGVIMIYQVPQIDKFLRWLLGWGTEYEVLAPDGVREQVDQIARQISDQHRQKKTA